MAGTSETLFVSASQYNHRIESKNCTCVAHVSDIAMTDKDGPNNDSLGKHLK